MSSSAGARVGGGILRTSSFSTVTFYAADAAGAAGRRPAAALPRRSLGLAAITASGQSRAAPSMPRSPLFAPCLRQKRTGTVASGAAPFSELTRSDSHGAGVGVSTAKNRQGIPGLQLAAALGCRAGVGAKWSGGSGAGSGVVHGRALSSKVPNRTGGLQMTPEELETVGPLLDWMQTRFEWDRDVAVKIVQSRPWLRSGKYSIEDDFDRKIEWFQQRMEVEDADTAALMVGRAVGILRLDHDEIEGKLRGLEEMLDLGSPSVLKMVRDYPRILTESVVDLQRRVRWLEERLQISSTNRKILVCLSPRSLVTSVDKVLEPVVEWAQTELNMNNQKLGVMFLKYPKWLFQVGPGGLSYRLRWLQTALSLSKDDAASLMRREGRLWLLDRVNLWPKLVLFRDSGASPTTLRDEILRSPGILCASLEGRVRVRMAALRQAGILFDFAQHGRIVCCMADKKFSQWMADQEGRGDS